jgi:cytochrome c oxidase subunit II
MGWPRLVALPLLLAGCAAVNGGDLPQNALDPAGPVARVQHDLWRLVFPIAVGVFVLVQGLILFAVVRFRDRGQTGLPRQVHGNTRLELIWTIIPALILAGIAFPTVRDIFVLSTVPAGDVLEVRVVGKQFWWEFEYLGEEGQGIRTANELHIPVGRPITLNLEALHPGIPDTFDALDIDEGERSPASLDGVIHSFWVPRLAGKTDVVPGHVNRLTIEAEEPGQQYPGQCAEFCGLAHAEMRFWVHTHTPEEFAGWLEQQSQPSAPELSGQAVQGEELFGVHCVACHALRGHPDDAGIRIGPDLTHFATRDHFGGGLFDNDDPDQIAAWLRDPQAMKPGAQMPELGLTDDEVEALVAYLQALQ